jgi:hypothetical protein
MAAAEAIVMVFVVYAAAGLVFAIPFVLRGVNSVDSAASTSGIAFRMIILPGVVALWPVMLKKWMLRVSS